jgi:hypothetical protein
MGTTGGKRDLGKQLLPVLTLDYSTAASANLLSITSTTAEQME